MLRVYQDKMVFMDTPEQPVVQVPVYAIESVVEHFNPDYLSLDSDED